ncbi:MAG: hypothetical protein HRF51_05885 [bacterium]|jgi:hypothetical protein
MNCRKARHLLSEIRHWRTDATNLELVRHLKSCRSCAEVAAADGLLAKILRHARESEIQNNTPFQTFREKIESPRNTMSKESSIMATIKSQFTRRPRLALVTGIAALLLLFVTLVPLPYSRTIGYELVYNGLSPAAMAKAANLEDALAAVGYGNLALKANDNGTTVSYLPTRQAAREVALVISTVTGVKITPEIVEVIKKASGSLSAQALEQKRKIEIDAEGKSDAEIEADIIRKLAEAGYPGSQVKVTTNSDGQRRIDVQMQKQDASGEKQEQLELKVKDDSGKVGLDIPIELEIDAEGKTDAEVEAEIRAKLAEQGISNPQVTITTGPDGKRQVEVKAEKLETK